jgi:lysophospholipase L1-like esterase
MMHRLRANYPEAQIFFVVPFGGFAEDAITEAYQEIAPNDANLYLIDLGQTAKDIVSANSVDNIHPEKEGHRLLAELLYQVFLETEATRPPELVKTQPTARPAPTPILSGFASWLDGAR